MWPGLNDRIEVLAMADVRRPNMTSPRAFSLIEVMAVVAIVGVLGSLAAPNLVGLARGYRARESARAVLFAMSDARNHAQQKNSAVRVEVFSDRVVVYEPVVALTTGLLQFVSGWTATRTYPLAVTVTSVPTSAGLVSPSLGVPGRVFFCASSEASWIDLTTQQPFCPLGDLASASGDMVFSQSSATFKIRMRAAMASLSMGS